MKAIMIHEFGGPEVMRVEETERPTPAADEILIKVYASGVNPVDCTVRSGGNDILRPLLQLPLTPGWDAAGIVEEAGSAVTTFKKGDAVYGLPNFPGNGSYAEYCAAKASQFALKPKSLGFIEAAGVPLAALTAWAGIFGHGKLKAGQRIFITGASGSVGGFAVQFAKAKGAYVAGTASAKNLDYVKQLGADEVIDYTSRRFEDVLQDVDVVFEASLPRDNNERLRCLQVLKKGGTLVSANIDFPFNDEVKEAMKNKQVTGELAPNVPSGDRLEEIAELIDSGKVQVLVGKVFSLEEAAEAHREIESSHDRGKIVLAIKKEEDKA